VRCHKVEVAQILLSERAQLQVCIRQVNCFVRTQLRAIAISARHFHDELVAARFYDNAFDLSFIEEDAMSLFDKLEYLGQTAGNPRFDRAVPVADSLATWRLGRSCNNQELASEGTSPTTPLAIIPSPFRASATGIPDSA
jgi:hypothetical protein